MNRDSNKQSAIILAVIGILPVVWLGLLIAPSVKGGLPEILPSLLTAFNDPFHIELCAMAKEESTQILNKVLRTASEQMKNGFSFADTCVNK